MALSGLSALAAYESEDYKKALAVLGFRAIPLRRISVMGRTDRTAACGLTLME
jgi:hypothetical protein